MNGQDIGSGIHEVAEITVGLGDHQMDVYRSAVPRGNRLKGPDDHRAGGDVGHEMAVHDVDVEIVGPGGEDFLHLRAETSEIGREYGRGEMNPHARQL